MPGMGARVDPAAGTPVAPVGARRQLGARHAAPLLAGVWHETAAYYRLLIGIRVGAVAPTGPLLNVR